MIAWRPTSWNAMFCAEWRVAQAIGSDRKGKLSLLAYVIALAFSFVVPWVSVALFVAVAISWFIPDRRVERVIVDKP